jgi:hypothetical protein
MVVWITCSYLQVIYQESLQQAIDGSDVQEMETMAQISLASSFWLAP